VSKPSFLKDDRGSSAVEFALVAPILFALLFGTIEVGVQGMVSSSLENAVAAASRTIRTGEADGPASASDFKNLVCAGMIDSLSVCNARLAISVAPFSSFSSAGSAATAAPDGTFNKGGPSDIILVHATYSWPAIAPTFDASLHRIGPTTVVFSTQAAFKNEPFT
jgi:Flp pilus assembly protein TadG